MENTTITKTLSVRDLIGNPRQVLAVLNENLKKSETEWNINYDNSGFGLKNLFLGNKETGIYYNSDMSYNQVRQSMFTDLKYNCDDLYQSIEHEDDCDENEYNIYCDFVNKRSTKNKDEEDYKAYLLCRDRYDEYIHNYSDNILLQEYTNLKDEKLELIQTIKNTKECIEEIITEYSEIDFNTPKA
jgi:hypothetical protein